jgi:hypothetical protein
MKKITLTIAVLLCNFLCFAQDTEAPTTPTNFQFSSNPASPPDSISVLWDHATDNVGVATYEIYINGVLEEIVAYDGSNPTQFQPFLDYQNGNYCMQILARDAAGNASPLSSQICKSVSIVYQNPPVKPYFSGLLNFSGDNKAIEISNGRFETFDLSIYSLKISYDGSGTWDATYTFPGGATIANDDTYIIAHPSISICSTPIDDYNSTITNFDGNDVIGLFKHDILYDVVGGNLGSSTTAVSPNVFLKKETLSQNLPITNFNVNEWVTYADTGMCPTMFGFTFLILLDTEDETLDSFQMYPNPTNGNTVFFQTKNNATIDAISVYDISGKQVLQQTNISNKLDVQNLQQGMYILQLQIGNQTVTRKLVKQ